MQSIFIVEDDESIVKSLSAFLSSEGFLVESATGSASALVSLRNKNYDLIILDLHLSDGDGFSLFKEIRTFSDTPVIFLTASSDEGSIVKGLEIGGDDYISKPFRPRELVARIRRVIRGRNAGASIQFGNIVVDSEKGIVTKNGEEVQLSALEYRILMLFATNRGILLTRERLLEEIWDIAGDFVNDNTLTVYIKRIREKIEDNPAEPTIIKTVRGMGYRLD
ncbi:MAG: response regulator transcription factor [Clostridiales bacterium]|nr:response regulator transcription factor [Clostridiales bacterium]